MHGRCCCCFACFFPDIPRDVFAVTGGPELIYMSTILTCITT